MFIRPEEHAGQGGGANNVDVVNGRLINPTRNAEEGLEFWDLLSSTVGIEQSFVTRSVPTYALLFAVRAPGSTFSPRFPAPNRSTSSGPTACFPA